MDKTIFTKALDKWETARLEDVAVIVMGQSPSGEYVNDWDGNFSHIGLPFLQGNGEFGNKYPLPNKWCIKPLKIAKAQDILISVRAPVGDLNLADQSVCIGRGLAAIRFVSIDISFGWHVMNWARYWLKRLTQGSTFEAIGRTEIESLPIPIPALTEQQRIASVLDGIDNLLDSTEEITSAYHDLKTAMLSSLFAGIYEA